MRRCVDCKKELSGNRAERCNSCAQKKRFTTKSNHPRFGKRGANSPSWRGGRHRCVDCGGNIATYGKERCSSCAKKHLYKDPQRHPRFKSGISIDKNCPECGVTIQGRSTYCVKCSGVHRRIGSRMYPPEFNDKLKEEIRERDGHTCQNCGMTEEEHIIVIGKVLHVHHIDYDKKNCIKPNLVTTCRQCNLRANKNRDFWKKYYTDKMIARGLITLQKVAEV